ncbi:MAG: hypothetical protein IJV44_09045 [Prevotella sp.]|nr:hypothetical protein [Prevotella sp.]
MAYALFVMALLILYVPNVRVVHIVRVVEVVVNMSYKVVERSCILMIAFLVLAQENVANVMVQVNWFAIGAMAMECAMFVME